jgi:hypothetical protein
MARGFYLLLCLLVIVFVASSSYGEDVGIISRSTGGGGVLVIKEVPKGSEPIDLSVQNQLCFVSDGTKARILERKDYSLLKDFFVKVHILQGACKGKVGWIGTENLKMR